MDGAAIDSIIMGTQLYIISHLFWLSYKIGRLEAKLFNNSKWRNNNDNN